MPSVGANIQQEPLAVTNNQHRQQQQQSMPAIIPEPPVPSIDVAVGGGDGMEPAYYEESCLSKYEIRPICRFLIKIMD
jgi:hypothetical protein